MSDREDLYAALIGEGAKGPEKSALIAAALRRQKEIGQLGQLTGDKVLSGLGKNMSSEADQYATDFQGIRQHGIDDDQTALYQGGQLNHMDETLAQQKQRDQWTHEYQMAMAAAAQDRANRPTGSGKFKTIPATVKSKASGIKQGMDVLDDMEATFQDSFAGQKNMPGAGKFKNWAAANQVGPESWQPQQAWYANLERLYNLQERYKLFGATLTKNELEAWAQANLNPNMSPTQIREKLATLKEWAGNELGNNRAGYESEEFNPAEVAGTFTWAPKKRVKSGAVAAAAETVDLAAPKPRMKKVDGKWVAISGL